MLGCQLGFSQQIFTERSLTPGYDFYANDIQIAWPKIARDVDSGGYTLKVWGLQLLKIKGSDTTTYNIPIEEKAYESKLNLKSTEYVSNISSSSYYSGMKASVLHNQAAFRMESDYTILDWQSGQNRWHTRNILLYFDGNQVDAYDEHTLTSSFTDGQRFVEEVSHTNNYVHVGTVSGLVQFDKATKQHQILTPNDAEVPWTWPSLSYLWGDDSSRSVLVHLPNVFVFTDSTSTWKNRYPNDQIKGYSTSMQNGYICIGQDSLYTYKKGNEASYSLNYQFSELSHYVTHKIFDQDRYVIVYKKGLIIFDHGVLTTHIFTAYESSYPASTLSSLYLNTHMKHDSTMVIKVRPTGSGLNEFYQFEYNKGAFSYIGTHGNPGILYLYEKDQNGSKHLYYVDQPYFYHIVNGTDTTKYEEPIGYASSGNTYYETTSDSIWLSKGGGLGTPITKLWSAPKSAFLVTGVHTDMVSSDLVLMPNPVTSQITLKNCSESINWIIYDVFGNTMQSGSGCIIDAEGLRAGSYFLDTGRQQLKFVKL